MKFREIFGVDQCKIREEEEEKRERFVICLNFNIDLIDASYMDIFWITHMLHMVWMP